MGSFQQPIAKLILFFIAYLNSVANLQQWRLEKKCLVTKVFPPLLTRAMCSLQSLSIRKVRKQAILIDLLFKKCFFGPSASVWSKNKPPPPPRASPQDPPLDSVWLPNYFIT